MTFENLSGSPHHFLARLAGGWAGTSRLWLEPEVLTGEAPMIGNIQLILDGRFALFLYQTAVEGESQHGMFTFGYNTLPDRYEASFSPTDTREIREARWATADEFLHLSAMMINADRGGLRYRAALHRQIATIHPLFKS